jgi:hypothetical protein
VGRFDLPGARISADTKGSAWRSDATLEEARAVGTVLGGS